MLDFCLDAGQPACQINPRSTAFEAVLHQGTWMLVQHRLHHGEFV